MNERFIELNAKDAHEELTKLLQHLASGAPLDFADFHVAMAHAFHHLNSAWNGRNISDKDWRECTDETYARLEAFPADLPMIGDDAFFDLPEYESIFKDEDTEQHGEQISSEVAPNTPSNKPSP